LTLFDLYKYCTPDWIFVAIINSAKFRIGPVPIGLYGPNIGITLLENRKGNRCPGRSCSGQVELIGENDVVRK
jgi:hypothetical protein